MSRRIAALMVLLLAVLLPAVLLPARSHAQQSSPPLLSVTPDAADQHAIVRLGPVLAASELREAANAGLPVRLRIRTELWRDEFFDDLVQTVTWTAVLVYEPLNRRYYMRPSDSRTPARQFATYDQARGAIEGEIPVRLRPRRSGQYYYTSVLEIETLSVSDLQELERWLQGELRPAVEGQQSIPGAIGQGAKRLLIRVLDVPSHRVETRSGRFSFAQ